MSNRILIHSRNNCLSAESKYSVSLSIWLITKKILCVLAFLVLLPIFKGYGQSDQLRNQLLQITSSADSLIKSYPAEKLYLQFDKPAYATGDTIWFKAYLFHAATLALSAKSGILYIDIANGSGKTFKQYRLSVNQGLSWGNISLTDFLAGNYTLRAYTSWMRNFGADCFFTKHFIVADEPQVPNLTLNAASGTDNNQRIKDNRRPRLPQFNADIQFMPEGGNLVAGLPAHIGFKAIGVNGKGIPVSGTVINHKQQQVAAFNSLHLGMGSFDMMIDAGENYTARVNLPGGMVKDYPLPAVKASGTTLRVVNLAGQDSVVISLAATSDAAHINDSYFLIAKAKGIICYAADFNFSKNENIRKKIAGRLFPSGIAHFMLLNSRGEPLNERVVFIDRHTDLHITTATDKQVYFPHDSVALNITVRDAAGKPAMGNFSVAVTDDTLVKQDPLTQENIISHVLLSSELKGYVEEPGYYFQTTNAEARQALDNLLLTQGWVNYEWQSGKKQPFYPAETEFAVRGKVTNVFDKPVKGTRVTLLSKSPLLAMDTLTNNEGRFAFHGLPAIDTPAFVINAVNKHNNRFNVGIVMDEFTPPPLTAQAYFNNDLLFTDVDSGLIATAKINRIRRETDYFDPKSHVLKEVKIKSKKIVKDSQNLNGPGNADLILDEQDLEKEGKKSWLDIFKERIKGFGVGRFIQRMNSDIPLLEFLLDIDGTTGTSSYGSLPFSARIPFYAINGKPVKFIVDGISVGKIYSLIGQNIRDVTEYLKSHSAEDIKGIELNFSPKYNSKYIPVKFSMAVTPGDVCFLEITTRSGHGPVISNTIGTYLYKPLPLSRPAQFYEPRYAVNDKSKHLPDTRSTIYWQPNVNTDANGNATISFYTADKHSTYTIILEGTDINGNLGYKTQKVIVNGTWSN